MVIDGFVSAQNKVRAGGRRDGIGQESPENSLADASHVRWKTFLQNRNRRTEPALGDHVFRQQEGERDVKICPGDDSHPAGHGENRSYHRHPRAHARILVGRRA